MKRLFTTYLLISLIGLCAWAEEADKHADMVITEGVEMGKFTHDYDAALAYAKENQLPLMLVFTGSDWCGWCIRMDENVFSKPEWTAYAEDTIVQVWLDFPRNKDLVPEKYRERNAQLSEAYGVRGYPTYIILDSHGNRIGQLGAGRDKTPDSFKAELEKVLIMTPGGMKAYADKMNEADAAAVMAAFNEYREAQSKVAELESKLGEAMQASEEKKTVLDAVMEQGKVNALSPEKKMQYEAAEASVAEAEAKLQAWMEKNGETKPTPELREEFNALRKAVQEAREAKDNIGI